MHTGLECRERGALVQVMGQHQQHGLEASGRKAGLERSEGRSAGGLRHGFGLRRVDVDGSGDPDFGHRFDGTAVPLRDGSAAHEGEFERIGHGGLHEALGIGQRRVVEGVPVLGLGQVLREALRGFAARAAIAADQCHAENR